MLHGASQNLSRLRVTHVIVHSGTGISVDVVTHCVMLTSVITTTLLIVFYYFIYVLASDS